MIVWQSTAIESVKIHAFIKAPFTVFTELFSHRLVQKQVRLCTYWRTLFVRFFLPSFPMDRGNAIRLVRDTSEHQISMTSDFDE